MSPTATTHPTATSSSPQPSCTTAVPGKYGHVPFDACNSYYSFVPSFEGNLAFTVIFGLTTTAHVIEAIVYRKKYCWVIVMGAVWETAAFVLRTLGAHDQQQLQFAIWGVLLLLLAPLWINAFVYMTVARMIHFGLPEKKIWGIRAQKLTVLFVTLDIVCFLVQAVGGSMLSSDNSGSTVKLGMHIYIAGIAVQGAFIVIFGGMTVWFYHLLLRVHSPRQQRLKYLTWVMLAVMVLVMMRIIYRVIEFTPGVSESNPILAHEAYPFGLDATPMALALILLNLLHPGMVLRGPDSEFPKRTRAEKKAAKQQKKREKQEKKARKKALKNGTYEFSERLPSRDSAQEEYGGEIGVIDESRRDFV